MAIAHLLEDFGVAATRTSIGKFLDEEAIEDLRLLAFEQGYTAGWDDSVAAQERDRSRVTEALANNLEDLSFTYQEALNRMILACEPVFQLMLDKVLPAGLDASLAGLVVDQVKEMIREGASGPVRIALCANDKAVIAPLMPRIAGMPIELIVAEQLAPGCADIHVGDELRAFDSDSLITQITQAVEAFYHLTNEAQQHG